MNTTELDKQEPAPSRAERPRSYKSVYLNWTSYEVTVSEEGYHRILELIQQVKICRKCRDYYNDDNPNVAGNICLRCFLCDHSLTFIGLLDPQIREAEHSSTQPYEQEHYMFLDAAGYVYCTHAGPGKDETARQDVTATLKYWHFPIPEQAEKNGQLVSLHRQAWHVYGDLRNDAIILRFWDSYDKIDIAFLAERNGCFIQISRRKELDRRLLAEARAELEATRTPEGYLIEGKHQSQIWDADVYTLIAKQISQERQADQPGAE